MRKLAACLGLAVSYLFELQLTNLQPGELGCSAAVHAQGLCMAGSSLFGSMIRLWGLVPSGGGLAPSALISATVTTSDGTGVMNSNANAGNAIYAAVGLQIWATIPALGPIHWCT